MNCKSSVERFFPHLPKSHVVLADRSRTSHVFVFVEAKAKNPLCRVVWGALKEFIVKSIRHLPT